jgi:hypothetical protein
MSNVIRVTEEGIEIDGVLLKDTVDMKVFIEAHKPEGLSVGIGAAHPQPLDVLLHVWTTRHFSLQVFPLRPVEVQVVVNVNQPAQLLAEFLILQPYTLPVLMGLSQPQELQLRIGVNRPLRLEIPFHVLVPVPLHVGIRGWHASDMTAAVDSHRPRDLVVTLAGYYPSFLSVVLKTEVPKPLWVTMLSVPYHKFIVYIRAFQTSDFSVTLDSHAPRDINVLIDSHAPSEFVTYIRPMRVSGFKTWFFIIEQGLSSFLLHLIAVHSEFKDFDLTMHIWSLKNLTINMDLGGPRNLYASIWAWTPTDLSVAIATTYPPPLEIGMIPQPEDGVDLKIIHGFYKFTSISVNFNVWTEMYNLQVYLQGLYKSEFQVEFTMGSYHPLTVPIPGTSGYKNLFITCKPASRIMTTIIPVYTVEIKDLYISINQGWPCGFGSSYRNFSVTFDSAYFHAFTAVFKVISGSGTKSFGIFINRAYFDTYINKFDIHVSIPYEPVEPNMKIFDTTSIVYDNEFADLYQDVMQVTFSWPRIRLLSGTSAISVELLAYKGDKTYELSVEFYAQRQDPIRQLTSRPLMPRDTALGDPIWPDAFQVTEIELWGDDPPEVVRRIEIKFEEQIHEYYWVSSEQRAVSKRVWEQWSFLTRGYLPNAEYSGQIDYLTMRSLSSMKFYDTVDQAVKAMISNFLYSAKIDFSVSCNPHGSYRNLSIDFSIWDSARLKALRVDIEPMHTQTLSIDLTAI